MNMTPYRYNSAKHRANMYFKHRTNKPVGFFKNPYHKFFVHLSYDMYGYGFNHYKD